MRKLIALLLFCSALFAQVGTQYVFNVPPPPSVAYGTGFVVGDPGVNSTLYYWVVAKYTGGNSAPFGPITVNNAPPTQRLSTLRYIVVSWTSQANATGYDILRTATATAPTAACNCAVITNTSSTTALDQAATLNTYTVNSAGSVYATIYIDNQTVASPALKLIINGVETAVGSGGGGGGGLGDPGSNGLLKRTSLNTTAVATAGTDYETPANKNQNSGYAGLDSGGLIPYSRLGTGGTGAGTKCLLDNQTFGLCATGGSYSAGTGISISGSTISTDTSIHPIYYYNPTSDPAGACVHGRDLGTNGSTGALFNCDSTNTWHNVAGASVLPTQTGNSGKYLTTNGTAASWAALNALPSMSGNSGKLLTNDGTNPSWATFVSFFPSDSGNSGKYLTTNGSGVYSWGSPSGSSTTVAPAYHLFYGDFTAVEISAAMPGTALTMVVSEIYAPTAFTFANITLKQGNATDTGIVAVAVYTRSGTTYTRICNSTSQAGSSYNAVFDLNFSGTCSIPAGTVYVAVASTTTGMKLFTSTAQNDSQYILSNLLGRPSAYKHWTDSTVALVTNSSGTLTFPSSFTSTSSNHASSSAPLYLFNN